MSVNIWRALLDKVSIARMHDQINQLGRIGRLDTGGVTRLAFSPEDETARKLIMSYMNGAGLRIYRDPVGNLIGRAQGSNPNLPSVAVGSHIDTVINAGKYDGIIGTLAAIECVRVIRENMVPNSSIEVICFVMEESSRFGAGYGFGSRVMTGSQIADKELLSRDKEGITLAHAIQTLKNKETGSLVNFADERSILLQTRKDILSAKRDFAKIGAFVELHIEQGPVLEYAGKKIGVVTGTAAPTRFRVTISGEQNHSGTTPMRNRRDALAAAAEIVLAVESISNKHTDKGSTGTVGVIRAYPGVINVIPGRAEVDIDIRGIDIQAKEETVEAVLQEIKSIAKDRSISADILTLTNQEPIAFSNRISGLIEAVCSELDVEAMRLYSGAGHDASHIAKVTEAGMIFVPSINGVSHDPREITTPEDIKLGTQVLLATLLNLAVG